MIDIKKLITGFLILATAASMSAILLVSVNSGGSQNITPQTDGSAISGATIGSSQNQIGTADGGSNAFIPQSSADITADPSFGAGASALTAAKTPSDPNNLTAQLGDAFINNIVSTNPNGPIADANGDPMFNQPDTTSIALQLAEATATKNLQIPDWGFEAASQPIKITADESTSSVQQYLTAVREVLNNHYDSQVKSILGNPNGDGSNLGYVQSQIQKALGDTLALKTPNSFKNYQADLVKMLVYEKNMLQLVNTAQSDPLKASLIFQSEDAKLSMIYGNLQNDALKAAGPTSLNREPSDSPSAFVAAVDLALGIQTAHAQFAVFDAATYSLIATNTAHDIQTQIANLVKNVLLQILKNFLIALVQRKVLGYIQGSGAPRFITSWATTLVSAYTQTALNFINSKMYCVNSYFSSQINISLSTYYMPDGGNICSNSFQVFLGGHTVQQFYNNFSNGGWLAFGASQLPVNNYYDALFFKGNITNALAVNYQQSVSAKAIAGQGATGDQICTDGSNPASIHYACLTKDGDQYPSPCSPGDRRIAQANNGLCANGRDPKGTTPGFFEVSTANAASNATPAQISAANDIAGLLNSVVSSLLSGLANAAINAAGQATSGLLGENGSSIQGGGSTGGSTTPPKIPLSCVPKAQTVQTLGATIPPAAISATGGTNDANGYPPTYFWTSTDGTTSSDVVFTHAFPGIGTYSVSLGDSAGDATSTCQITVQ